MVDAMEYITSLWTNPRHPEKQVEIIAELSGHDVETVIKYLKAAGKIPRGVTVANYKEKLKALPPPPISEEMRRYIVGSVKHPQTLARELRMPMEEIMRIRTKAREEARQVGAERLKSLKRGVLAMRRMLREMETELEREIAEAAKGQRQDATDAEIRAISERVIGRLNDKTGRSYKPDNVNTLYLIRSRVEEGYTEEQLLAVVEEMCRCWGDDENRRRWLRPETLFGQHFENYLQEALSRQGSVFKHDELARLAIERIQGGNEDV